MKLPWWMTLLVLASVPFLALAGEESDGGDAPFVPPTLGDDFDPGRPHWEPPPPPEHAGPGGPHRGFAGHADEGEPPLTRWMEHLRNRNPEEFDRLSRLRQEDPEAFRRELGDRLQRRRVETRLKAMPKLQEYLMGLPEPERNELLKEIGELAGGGPRGGMPHVSEDPRARDLLEKTGELSRAYRHTDNAEERAGIKQELSAKVAELFDLQEKQREEMIGKMEQKLGSLKAVLEQRRTNRQEIIDRRIQELTDGDPLAW